MKAIRKLLDTQTSRCVAARLHDSGRRTSCAAKTGGDLMSKYLFCASLPEPRGYGYNALVLSTLEPKTFEIQKCSLSGDRPGITQVWLVSDRFRPTIRSGKIADYSEGKKREFSKYFSHF
jgi:hypothetical protein